MSREVVSMKYLAIAAIFVAVFIPVRALVRRIVKR